MQVNKTVGMSDICQLSLTQIGVSRLEGVSTEFGRQGRMSVGP